MSCSRPLFEVISFLKTLERYLVIVHLRCARSNQLPSIRSARHLRLLLQGNAIQPCHKVFSKNNS